MNPVTLQLTQNQAAALYFALNTALIDLDSKIKNGDKNRNYQSLEFERDLVREIQLLIPDSAIKL